MFEMASTVTVDIYMPAVHELETDGVKCIIMRFA